MSDTVTDADVEHLALTVGFLADDHDSTLTLAAAPVPQQDGGGGEPGA